MVQLKGNIMNLLQERTWRFIVNQIAPVTGSGGADTHANLLITLKNNLLGNGSWIGGEGVPHPPPISPFVVIASSNGVTAGFDGVDRWLNNTNLVWGTSTQNRSWIILRQPGLAPKFEVLIALETTSGSLRYKATVVVSPREGFGLANGGTDGSINTRPTAVDQIVLANAADYGASSSSTVPARFHVCMSDDGKDTRVFFTRNNAVTGVWLFSSANPNDSSAWTSPSVSMVRGDSSVSTSSNVINQALLMGNQYLLGRIVDITGCGFLCTAESVWNGTIADVQTIRNQATNKWPVGEIGLYSTSNLDVGHHGTLIDLFWAPSISLPSTNFADQVPGYEWRKVGPFLTPWPGNTPLEYNA